MSWRRLVQSGVDFCFPPACPGCEKPLHSEPGADDRPISPVGLCGKCVQEIAPRIPHACQLCGAPVGKYVESMKGCGACSATKFRFTSVVRLGVHQNALREAVLVGKTPGGQILMGTLTRLLFEREEERIRTFAPDFIVPVPRYWSKTLFQPQNTPLTMADLMANLLRQPVRPKGLRMREKRRRQSELSPTDRKINMKGAFRAKRGKAFNNARILLVDDVMTTGATANEASRALQEAGASEVMLAVLSRGIGGF